MGNWYRVVKTIKGHRYLYEQRTWRDGGRVRTQNRYIGSADGGGSDRNHPGTPEPSPEAELGHTPGSSHVFDPDLTTTALEQLTNKENENDSWKRGWGDERAYKSTVRSNRDIERLIKNHTININYTQLGASYNPISDVLTMPEKNMFIHNETENATQEFYGTLLHEIVHWTAHESRCNRRILPTSSSVALYAREELVAELGAVILLAHFGLAPKNLSNRTTYFRRWLKRIPVAKRKEALRYARHHADQAVAYILSTPSPVTTT